MLCSPAAAWAWLLFAGAFQEQALLVRLATLADILRYGAWFWFIQTLLRARSGQERDNSQLLLRWGVVLVTVVAVALQFLTAS